jgi:hypothetical protein
MNNHIDNALNETLRSSNLKFSTLKEKWKDNVQQSFYNDKVQTLHSFFTQSSQQLNEINQNFRHFKSELESI